MTTTGVDLGHTITLDEYRSLSLTRPLTWGPMSRFTARQGLAPDPSPKPPYVLALHVRVRLTDAQREALTRYCRCPLPRKRDRDAEALRTV